MADNNTAGGMKVEVTPPSPFKDAGDIPELGPMEERKGRKVNISHIIVPVVIIIFLLALVYFLVISKGPSTTITTTTPTTTAVTQSKYLSSCSNITSPGTYYLSGNIKTTNTQGACMNIESSSVALTCGGHSIIGSGPYSGVGPFSYGVLVSGASGVSISNCTIGNFSYGVYAQSSPSFALQYSNVTTNYVSDFYLRNSSNANVRNNVFAHSSSPIGSVIISAGSLNNLFENNSLRYNVFYGFNVSSSTNRFINNYVVGSQFSFECIAKAGFPSSNLAQQNTCFNQTGCDFLTCQGINVPVNVSQVQLSSPITSCGSINAPGSYSLTSDLNMRDYSGAAISTLAYYKIPCLRINAKNVALNCNGHTISNAYAGIEATAGNVTISNCNAVGSDIGILLNGVSNGKVTNSIMILNNASIELVNSLGISLSNISAYNNSYGVYFSSSSADIVNSFITNSNHFGLYLTNSYGNIFNNGVAENNSGFDVFATKDSYNATANLMSSTTCGLTDTKWATCAQRTNGTTYLAYPISACQVIKRSGTYTLTQNIISAPSDCMRINASDVSLNCAGFELDAQKFTPGAGVVTEGQQNVSVKNCDLINYNTGIQSTDTNVFNFSGNTGQDLAGFGILAENSKNGVISGSDIQTPGNASLALIGVQHTLVADNKLNSLGTGDIAISLNNSANNTVENNSASANNYGLYIRGASNNNTVQNNTMTSSGSADYYCDAQNGGILAENGGINTGNKKSGCTWMAMLPPASGPLFCTSYTTPQTNILAQDYVYNYGAICLKFIGNDSTLNCNGHTIIATSGGTLAQFADSKKGLFENCYLKGFTTPVLITGASATVFNNTMYESASSLFPGAPAINVSNSALTGSTEIRRNLIVTPGRGISLNGVTSAKILSNNVTAGSTAYTAQFTNLTQFTNNTATRTSGEGLTLFNSTGNNFLGNSFFGLTSGIICSGTSQSAGNNFDQGQNSCSFESNCNWISSSSSTCK